MNILFIHGNFPAQFKNIAQSIAADKSNSVIFLTSEANKNNNKIEGVEVKTYAVHRNIDAKTHHYLHSSEEAVINGQAVLRSLIELINSNWKPNVVITHGGNGLGMFVKDLLPQQLHVGYFEWYFKADTTRWLVKEMDFNTQLMSRMRNTPILHELANCDIGIVPTEWQKMQFPQEYHKKLNVIFDGIDTSFFREAPENYLDGEEKIVIKNRESKEEFEIKKGEKIITYATRGMEPVRGFPEFINAAVKTLKENKGMRAFIAGKDRIAYSYGSPRKNGSWKDYLYEQVDSEIKERMIFCGLLDYIDYRKLLWRSDLHCYFTRPYVTSWSMFEAGACGCNMLVNTNEATKGILKEDSFHQVDLDNEKDIVNRIENGLRNKRNAKLVGKLDKETSIRKWGDAINAALRNKTYS